MWKFVFPELKIEENCVLVTLPDKKWHWKARTGALTVSELIPKSHNFKYAYYLKFNCPLFYYQASTESIK